MFHVPCRAAPPLPGAPGKLQNFLDKFWFAGTLYFLSYPIFFVITSYFASYLRHKFITVGLFCSFALTIRWLERLFLHRKGQFFQLSTLSAGPLPSARTSYSFVKDS